MCGICGLAATDGAPVPRERLEAMNEALIHRGPDSAGMHLDAGVGLAMRRLSIIDLAGGDQPIFNEDRRICAVQNGEIYNYRELRDELQARGHRFATASDTEVIVHLYEEHGADFATRLRGMFAIAVWDAPARTLVLARDGFGIKPLYYAQSGDRLGFASEVRSLLEWGEVPLELDPTALHAYLTFNWVPGERSVLRHVRRLAPGHVLIKTEEGVTTRRYVRHGADGPPTGPRDLRTAAVSLLETLRDSVRAHLVADVPVGVLLSGGVDSSMLTALAAQVSGEPVKTFSIGFDVEPFNELAKARRVAERYGTDHHELMVRPDAADLLPKLAGVYDEPLGDSSALPTYLVSQMAAEQVKVVLGGEGGDELFAGYYTYIGHQLSPRTLRLMSRALPLTELIPSGSGPKAYARKEDKLRRYLAAAGAVGVDRHVSWQSIMRPDAREALLEVASDGDPLDYHRSRFEESADAEPIARFQDLDLGTYLVDDLLMKSDRASMAHSLEMRVPFVDREVARAAFDLPDDVKVRGFKTKRVLREAARMLLDPEILDAPKQGFSIPAAQWLREDLREMTTDLLSPERLRATGLLAPAPVERLLRDHVQRRRDNSRPLWGLLMLSLWTESLPSAPTLR